jgi:hypothetical protein
MGRSETGRSGTRHHACRAKLAEGAGSRGNALTFDQQVAELAQPEVLAQKLDILATAFEQIAINVTHEAQNSSVRRSAAQTLAETTRRI